MSQKVVCYSHKIATIVSFIKSKHDQILAEIPLNKKLEEFRKIYKDKLLKGIIKTQMKNLLKDIYPSLKKKRTVRRSTSKMEKESIDKNQDVQMNYVCKIRLI